MTFIMDASVRININIHKKESFRCYIFFAYLRSTKKSLEELQTRNKAVYLF